MFQVLQPHDFEGQSGHIDAVEGVEVRVDSDVTWPEWNLWLRSLIDEGRLKPFGVDLSRTEKIHVLNLSNVVPRLSGMVGLDQYQHHYLIGCEMEHGFCLCLPLTLTRFVSHTRLMADTGPDEARSIWAQAAENVWESKFHAIPHYTVSEFVRHYRLTLSERVNLHDLLQQRLPKKLFDRVSPAVEYRN